MKLNGSTPIVVAAGLLAACNSGDGAAAYTPVVYEDASSYGASPTDAAVNDAWLETSTAADGARTDATILLTDGQIVAVVLAANTGEIEMADLCIGASMADAGPLAALDASVLGSGAGASFEAGEAAPPDSASTDASLDAGIADASPDSGAGESSLDAGVARFSSPAVAAFAEATIHAHTTSTAALEGFGISPETCSVETTLQGNVASTLALLSGLSGPSFDIAYAGADVATQTTLLAIVRQDLIPNATNAALRTFLQETLLPEVESDLSMAKALLAGLQDSGAGYAATEDASRDGARGGERDGEPDGEVDASNESSL